MQPSFSGKVVVDGHGCHTALNFGVKAKENHDKVPTLYWSPKLHKKPLKQDLLLMLVLLVLASVLRYTGYLNFINGPINCVLLLILVHVQLLSCLFF